MARTKTPNPPGVHSSSKQNYVAVPPPPAPPAPPAPAPEPMEISDEEISEDPFLWDSDDENDDDPTELAF